MQKSACIAEISTNDSGDYLLHDWSKSCHVTRRPNKVQCCVVLTTRMHVTVEDDSSCGLTGCFVSGLLAFIVD